MTEDTNIQPAITADMSIDRLYSLMKEYYPDTESVAQSRLSINNDVELAEGELAGIQNLVNILTSPELREHFMGRQRGFEDYIGYSKVKLALLDALEALYNSLPSHEKAALNEAKLIQRARFG